MTMQECKSEIARLNSEYREFITRDLPEMLGAENGKISAAQWFEAQRIITARGFYNERYLFLKMARADGHDVKINMQDYELKYYGTIEGGDEK